MIGLTAPAIPFLPPGCTNAESKLACQLLWSHNETGRFHAHELAQAANRAFDQGDPARAFVYLRHVKAARRRGMLA